MFPCVSELPMMLHLEPQNRQIPDPSNTRLHVNLQDPLFAHSLPLSTLARERRQEMQFT